MYQVCSEYLPVPCSKQEIDILEFRHVHLEAMSMCVHGISLCVIFLKTAKFSIVAHASEQIRHV
jgi:hypothetical protein